jgi:hypothetical protein
MSSGVRPATGHKFRLQSKRSSRRSSSSDQEPETPWIDPTDWRAAADPRRALALRPRR